MSFMQLPNELITNIIHRLSTYDLTEVLYCHSRFYHSFDCNQYFLFQFNIDVKLNNDILVKYHQLFINDLNNYFLYNFIINDGELSQSDINYHNYRFEEAKNNIKEKLVAIDEFVKKYHNHPLYNSETKFLAYYDLDDDYFVPKDMAHITLIRNLGKIVVITDRALKDVLDVVEKFKIEREDDILILMT